MSAVNTTHQGNFLSLYNPAGFLEGMWTLWVGLAMKAASESSLNVVASLYGEF